MTGDYRPGAIDVFCVVGGLSLGLRRAGFRVLAAVDIDAIALKTYRRNHRRTRTIECDIRQIDVAKLMHELGLRQGELDLLAGCPPCQGFSRIRTLNGAKDIADPAKELVFEYLRFVEHLAPRSIMLENVPRLLDDPRMRTIGRSLTDLGYRWHASVFDAVDFGVPQRRRRAIIVGAKRLRPDFARPINRKWTVRSAFRRLREESGDPTHGYVERRSARVREIIRRIPKDGGSRKELDTKDQLTCHRGFDGFKDVYGRMSWGKPAPTVTGGCINPSKGRFLHPDEDRAITLREAALLQGFPISYGFDLSGGRYRTAQLIGNALPPKFAEHHARALARSLGLGTGSAT